MSATEDDLIHISFIKHSSHSNVLFFNLPGGIVGGSVVGGDVVDSINWQIR